MTEEPSRAKVWLALAVIAAAVLATYANSLTGPFVFDDPSSIVANPTIRHLGPGALSPPNASITVQGRPMLNLSLAINYAISGTDVWSYHALNVAIHLLAALTLFGLVRRTLSTFNLQLSTPVAFATALLWAVHPLQTESVTYVIQRAESLMGLFFLLTLYAFARGVTCHPLGDKSPILPGAVSATRNLMGDKLPSGPVGWLVVSVGCCALGMATKEVTAVAPLVVLLYDRTFVSGSFREALRRHRWLYAGLAATWLVSAWLVFAGGGNRGGSFGTGVTPWAYWLTQFPAIVRYLALTFRPSPLVFEYGTFWVAHPADVALAALLVLGLLGLTIWAIVRKPRRGFLGACFFLILAPTSLLPGTTQMIVEHRMYLPLAALIAAVVLFVHQRLGPKALLGFLPIGLVLGFGTASRNADYRSEVALWRDTVEKRPRNALAHQLLAAALEKTGDTAGAVAHYESALQLKPDFALTHDTLGLLLFRLGRPDEATAHFETALKLQPEFADAHDHLGVALARQRKWPEAIAQHEAALRLKPDFPDAHFNLANVLAAQKRNTDAAPHYEAALRLRPDFAAAHYNYANLLAETGRAGDAVPHYQETVRLKPDHADAYNNLGGAYIDLGDLPKAAAAYEAALRINPNLTHARENLARVRAAAK